MIDAKYSFSDNDDGHLNAPGQYLLDTLPEKEYDAITRLGKIKIGLSCMIHV